jgi:hypothetical protein
MERWTEAEERALVGHQFVATVVARSNGNKDADFVKLPGASRKRPKKKPEPAPQPWTQQLAIVADLNRALGGNDLRGVATTPGGTA